MNTTPEDDYAGDELIDDRLDPEAQLLCSMVWHPQGVPALNYVAKNLSSADFYNPMYGHIFSVISEAVIDGMPHDPSAISVRLAAAGGAAESYQRVLLAILGLGTTTTHLIYYADQLVSTWYRRQFSDMAQMLVQIAEEAPEAELFDRMVEQGRQQRAARERRETFLERARQYTSTSESENK